MERFCWCKHCERAWITVEWVAHKGCPAGRCNAYVADRMPWSFVLEMVPSYPKIPNLGRRYPLVGSWGF
jgi:hypothetical protein